MIRDVLAHVADGPVGAHDDFCVVVGHFFRLFGERRRALHHPATGVLAFSLQVEDTFVLHMAECEIPEMQVQDFALAWKEVVLDGKPVHGLKVTAENGGGDQLGDLGNFVVAFFDRVQGLGALLLVFGVFFVPGRRGCVDVPADVVKPRLLDESLDVFLALALEFTKSDHDVGNLNAGVVDVILHVDRIAVEAK